MHAGTAIWAYPVLVDSKHFDQWNKIQNPERPTQDSNWLFFFFYISAKTTQWKKIFSTNSAGSIGHFKPKKNIGLNLPPHIQKLIGITGFHVNHKSTQFSENTGGEFLDLRPWEHIP